MSTDRPLVDTAALAAWMDGQGLGEGDITQARRLGGGTQNVMLRLRRGDREYVLRRPPEHPRPTSEQTLLREMRVVSALGGTDVPHPRFLAGCTDPAVLGTVFYVMEPVEGFNPRELLPPRHAADPALRHALSLEVVDAAARLAAVDHARLGLADLGRPDGFLERQVPRWLRELDGYAGIPGYPGPQLPGLERIAGWLDDNRPRSEQPGLMHGDFHFGNVMIAWHGPEVVAVVDWEMATIGDPLLDLGWLLATWPRGAEDREDGPIATAGGWPPLTRSWCATGNAGPATPTPSPGTPSSPVSNSASSSRAPTPGHAPGTLIPWSAIACTARPSGCSTARSPTPRRADAVHDRTAGNQAHPNRSRCTKVVSDVPSGG